MEYLWAQWDKLQRTLSAKPQKLILLDFDGTLLPIAPSPSAVSLNPKTKRILDDLSRGRSRRLAIVSGRPLGELYAYLRLKNVFYAGNHGLETRGWGLPVPSYAAEARKLKNLIGLLARKFGRTFSDYYEGLWVENKGYTLSLHYRKVPREQKVLFEEMVRFFRDKYKRYPLVWTRGKKVWEIRPNAFWGKGDLVLYLMRKFPRALPVVIGDDRADEDMFRMLGSDAVTVRVGHFKHSAAKYYLKSPYDVRVFLRKLCH